MIGINCSQVFSDLSYLFVESSRSKGRQYCGHHSQRALSDLQYCLCHSFQVAPAELEAYLNAHPAVADAGVTAIYSDDDATEYPKAFIVPKDTSLLESSAKLGQACPKTIAFVTEVLKHIESKVIDYKW